ncbi:DUF1294 domain-containing protein [Sphingosinicella microcystinivorans]|uniref:Uncharacterized membrane protein YsdA (DUF1294 family) n=1 Tax=Sphingosinicella microcystinivorans TaxID=335406 RepID=A0AAD1FZN2_SPHMI|nr:DUF1294 domain-containing protein [Sphingosinicella microcystinivorans]RKS89000.1 uncharacterized membrane protein YsdA (DUF1294 family) [Sphingosinicella microcystinivorans]BBE32755.1 hypothetical protein SmB9_04130 [Sphingosinicella microcystinivorans]
MGTIAYYLIAVNLAAFAAYVWDKHLAETGGRRISESTLLGLACLGGSPGAWAAMRLVRHKTRKASFQTSFRVLLAVQIVLLVAASTERGRAFLILLV